MHQKHAQIFSNFNAKFAPEITEKWTKMVEEWDMDSSKPDPYEEPIIGLPIYFLSCYNCF